MTPPRRIAYGTAACALALTACMSIPPDVTLVPHTPTASSSPAVSPGSTPQLPTAAPTRTEAFPNAIATPLSLDQALCSGNPQGRFGGLGAELQILRHQCRFAARSTLAIVDDIGGITRLEWLEPTDNYIYPSQGEIWIYEEAGADPSGFVAIFIPDSECCAVTESQMGYDPERVVFRWER